MSDPQDVAEALDADKIDDRADDEVIADVYPPDQPLGVRAWGTTANEERRPEPLADFVGREEPDPLREVLEQEAEERP
ncbi:MAG: hypothetical protein AVDCRST_MAG76-832 [uncultured Acidimicrobiales bacterium]|uniref:Uncharacterized protein n=1 Tax=uncultured Acidimicrobiales bacterium TaxID=310071 RepID=A0A6J4HGL2_9ACTN|nr:MAG: hypothetical protein AVDCRST_MAG76-832 [uncultured Acidimicrobiales bacterium]